MFGTIRKHQAWLWSFLVAVMSVSLVALFTSDYGVGGGGGRRGQPDLGSINGRPIDQAEYYEAEKEVRIATFLHGGKWPGNDEATSRRLESETVSRVFLLHKLKEMDIKASDKAVAFMLHEQLRDYPKETMEREILNPNKLTWLDYDRYVRNEAAIRQLIIAASVGARLVTPAEAEEVWRRENQEIVAQAACFWTTDYLSKVAITNGAISNFYSLRMNRDYRLPERITLSYIAFNASNYLAEADSRMAKITNLNEIISDFYFRGTRGGTNVWTDTNGAPLPEAAAKEKIRERFREDEALLSARRAAAEFGTELMSRPEPNVITNLDFLAAQKKLAVRITLPFDR